MISHAVQETKVVPELEGKVVLAPIAFGANALMRQEKPSAEVLGASLSQVKLTPLGEPIESLHQALPIPFTTAWAARARATGEQACSRSTRCVAT